MRTINEEGKELIKRSETLALEPYLCPAGVLTIGYGHTGDDVWEGMIITEEEAEDLLERDIAWAEREVRIGVRVELTENQFSALVSFVFNVGRAAFRSSTLLKKLNVGDYDGAAEEFGKWIHSKGKVLKGLVTRREVEKNLFLDG